MNFNNLAQKTNYIAGSDAFKHIPFFLTSINLPGLSLSHPLAGGRHSTRLNLSADTVNWNSLSFEMLIDEDFKIYKEVHDLIKKNIKLKDGTFRDFYFDFFIEISNNKGNKVLRMDFSNCRIASIGDIDLSTQDEATEHTMQVEMVFDYFEIENNPTYVLRD